VPISGKQHLSNREIEDGRVHFHNGFLDYNLRVEIETTAGPEEMRAPTQAIVYPKLRNLIAPFSNRLEI